MEDNKEISLILCRILSGYYIFTVNSKSYILKYPSMSIRYAADIFVEQEYDTIKYNSWLSQDDILYFLKEHGLWSNDGDKLLISLEKQIEDYKVQLFLNYLNPPLIKQLRQKLIAVKKNYSNLYSKRHSFDYITMDGYISNIRDQYILANSIYNMDNTLVFNNINNIDITLFNNLATHIANHIIDIDTFRLLARSSKWKNYWISNKDNIFGKPAIEWTEEQQTLVLMSRMYDNAYEHPECPPDKIIEDDDMFDGWMIHNRRINEKNKEKNRTEKMIGDKNFGKAQEVFLTANSFDEAAAIYNLNDPVSRNTIRERSRIIDNSKDGVRADGFPDVQRDLSMQMNQKVMRK